MGARHDRPPEYRLRAGRQLRGLRDPGQVGLAPSPVTNVDGRFGRRSTLDLARSTRATRTAELAIDGPASRPRHWGRNVMDLHATIPSSSDEGDHLGDLANSRAGVRRRPRGDADHRGGRQRPVHPSSLGGALADADSEAVTPHGLRPTRHPSAPAPTRPGRRRGRPPAGEGGGQGRGSGRPPPAPSSAASDGPPASGSTPRPGSSRP